MPRPLMPRPVCVKPTNVAGPWLQQIATSNDIKDADYEKWTVPQLRAALQRHGQPKTGRKAELLSRWKEFKERGQEQQGLLQQCEQLLPDILAKVDVDRFTYRQLTEDMERKLDLEPHSLESIRPQLKAAVTSYMSRKQGGPQTSITVSGRRKADGTLRIFTWGCWTNPEKAFALGAAERASLSADIKRLSNFKRVLADGDQRLPDAKRMLLIMREKLNEHIQREGRKTVQRQEVDKAQCTLLLARTESDEVYKKLATLGKTMANNLQSFSMREHGWRKPARLYCGADGVCPACNKPYGSRSKALDHLSYRSKKCKAIMQAGELIALPPETVRLLDEADCTEARAMRARARG